ncbi:MAG: DUF559 domain-containing protein, partial [Oscillospiraceae bacterium]|nr:DUF559 domain-containing protein [Oscillospiraceae bacterium]
AIECDGERWHSGEAKVREDMERQTILERLGWRFIRIRGSEYYRNPEKTMERVIRELSAFGIEPEESTSTPIEGRTSALFQRVKSQAELALLKEDGDEVEPIEETIAGALDPLAVIRDLPKTPSPLPQAPANKEVAKKPPTEAVTDEKNAVPKVKNEPVISKPELEKRPKVVVETIFASPEKNRQPTKAERVPSKAQSSFSGEQTAIPGMEEKKQKASDVIDLLKQNKIKYVDKRQSNGALWIIGGRELDPIVRECRKLGISFRYKEDGGRQTGHKPGWWAK